MFHTILNYYDVFKTNNDTAIRNAREYKGLNVDTYKIGDEEYVERLHSTNPYDYLDPQVYPFTNISSADENRRF